MHTVINILIWIGCSLCLSVFSFILGRCARRLPLIDNRAVPWVISLGRNPLWSKVEHNRRFPGVPSSATDPMRTGSSQPKKRFHPNAASAPEGTVSK